MHPSDLFNKLMYEYAKHKSQQLTQPIRLVSFANACNINQSTVIRYIQTDTVNKNLSPFSTITDSDIETFLNHVKKLRWNYGKDIPSHLEPYADILIENVKKETIHKIIAKAEIRELDEQDYYQEYEPLPLEALGKLYGGGKNPDLDDIENDAIRKLINRKLLLNKDNSHE